MVAMSTRKTPTPKPIAKKTTMTRDIQFLFEMGCIRFIDRMWRRFLNGDFSNLAEHHFRMFWIAMTIAKYEGGDTGKIAKLVLVHDISESRTGDVDYIARQYTERNELLGLTDMLEGTVLKDEFMALWQEYEARETLEAKIAKDADNLDVDFELIEQAAQSGNPLHKNFDEMRKQVGHHKLYTKTAKAIQEQLQTANPHAWHLQGRNRVNSGDWKR